MGGMWITVFDSILYIRYNKFMEKESKNLGITKACPECRRILIKSANIIGHGSFKTKCPHCKTLITLEVGQKTFINVFKTAILIVFIISAIQIFVLNSLNDKFAYLLNSYVPTLINK